MNSYDWVSHRLSEFTFGIYRGSSRGLTGMTEAYLHFLLLEICFHKKGPL